LEGSFEEDESGTCQYRIERSPKIFDPNEDELVEWKADVYPLDIEDPLLPNPFLAGKSKGQVPLGCRLIARYGDGLILASPPTAPHVWFRSRRRNPHDWDYSRAAFGDVESAIASDANYQGVVGEPIVALIEHSDDYLLFGCTSSLWILRGEPLIGGSLDNLSQTLGIVGPNAWCRSPSGVLFFLSKDGLYTLQPGASEFPQSLSREKIPQRLLDIPITYSHGANLAYDLRFRMVHIYLPQSHQHYWFNLETGSFWPIHFRSILITPIMTLDWTSSLSQESHVLLGGTDGFLRRFGREYRTDDRHPIIDYVYIGPIRLSSSNFEDGMLSELIASVAEGSGRVRWQIFVADTIEAALTASPSQEGIWNPGLNHTDRPRVRGSSFFLRLSSSLETGFAPWSIERVTAARGKGGKKRLP
jgi:hypothetical protein